MSYYWPAQEVVYMCADFICHLFQGSGPIGIRDRERQSSRAERHRPALLGQRLTRNLTPKWGQNFDHRRDEARELRP
jgi:hypothetical protein